MSGCRGMVSMVKTCQRCGSQFGCGVSCCWCDEIRLTDNVRARMQRQFSDCLCRGCLETLAAEGENRGRESSDMEAKT